MMEPTAYIMVIIGAATCAYGFLQLVDWLEGGR